MPEKSYSALDRGLHKVAKRLGVTTAPIGGTPSATSTQEARAQVRKATFDKQLKQSQVLTPMASMLGLQTSAYPSPAAPDAAARAQVQRRVAASKEFNLYHSNPNVAVHASNELDGQTGLRARMGPNINAALFPNSQGAKELRAGKALALDLKPIKATIDGANFYSRSGAGLAATGQGLSSTARNIRGGTQLLAATTLMSTGNPVAVATIATAGGAAETSLRVLAAGSHRASGGAYSQAASRPLWGVQNAEHHAPIRAGLETEAKHQDMLGARAMRQAGKAALATGFGATPLPLNHLLDVSVTANEAAIEHLFPENLGHSSPQQLEMAKRGAEVGLGDVENKVIETLARGANSKRSKFWGPSKNDMQAHKEDRVRSLQGVDRSVHAAPTHYPAPVIHRAGSAKRQAIRDKVTKQAPQSNAFKEPVVRV